VNVTPQLAATLQRLAESADVSLAHVIRQALRDYALAQSERKGWS
jgi:predicted transcriptional regulator